MPKSTFIPSADPDFLVWYDHLIAKLTPENGVSESDLAALKAANSDFHDKTVFAGNAAAVAKQATADKHTSRQHAESLIRAEVRRIKARSDYNQGLGLQLGIEGAEMSNDLANASPNLSGIDQTGGVVALNFYKNKSDGINIYCQRENDTDWILLARATVSPYLDNRPLLKTGKPELRRYSAIFMVKDKEVGKYSNDLVITCAP
ncbi:MAG: hypothetical protein ABL919_11890 [Methylococcales bacterium]|nr:hypothetical protein [Methylococcaceae bacterium]